MPLIEQPLTVIIQESDSIVVEIAGRGATGLQGIPGNDGAPGAAGAAGTNGADGVDGVGIAIAEIQEDKHLWITLTDSTQQDAGYVVGPQGDPGQGIPIGGASGQFLRKATSTDYDTEWATSSTVVADINDISNVVITTPADGEILTYDSLSSTWINAAGVVYEPANANIQSHISSTSNPHSVTASQTGAYTSGQVDTLLTGKSDTSHTHSGVYQPASVTDTVTTTDGTPTVIQVVAIPTDTDRIVSVKVRGQDTGTGDILWKTMTFGVKNVAGTASLVGGVDSAVGYDAGASTWSVVTGVSLGNVTVTVSGEALKTVNWVSFVDTY